MAFIPRDSKMTKLKMTEAFGRYGATLKNRMWSVSAWTPDDELVLSMWAHHHRKGAEPGTVEYAAATSRWEGPGKKEFVENVDRAYAEKRKIRLVIATTKDVGTIERGEDASKVDKDFDVRADLIGEVAFWDGEQYVVRFRRA